MLSRSLSFERSYSPSMLVWPHAWGDELAGQVEIVPAYDAVSDEAVAAFDNLLGFLFGMFDTAQISGRDGPGEVREFRFVELPLDCLSQFNLIDITQDEQGFDDLAEKQRWLGYGFFG